MWTAALPCQKAKPPFRGLICTHIVTACYTRCVAASGNVCMRTLIVAVCLFLLPSYASADRFQHFACDYLEDRWIREQCFRYVAIYNKGLNDPAFKAAIPASATECLEKENTYSYVKCAMSKHNFSLPWPPSYPNWSLLFGMRSWDKQKAVLLTTQDPFSSSCPTATLRASLSIECKANTTSIDFHFGGCIVSSAAGFGRVTFLTDSDQPFEESLMSESSRSLGHWTDEQAVPLIKKLLTKSTLRIQAKTYGDNPADLKFNIRGLDEMIKPLRSACSW